MRILNRVYLVLAAVTGVVGAIQCYRWSTSVGTSTVWYLLNSVPAAVFLLAYALGRKASQKALHVIIVFLCFLAVGFWGFVTIAVDKFINATAEVTDVRRYDAILTKRWDSWSDLAQHFPRPIPSNAKDVRFSFRPAFLQGGAHVQLRYSASAATIAELYERFSRKKTKSFIGGNSSVHEHVKEGMPTTSFYTSGSESREFPEDYEIMIFDDILKEEDRPPGFYWNHGRSHGVAISRQRNEIVYWAEFW